MSKGKKIAVALTRALLGQVGVDCFIMGKPGIGVGRIILSLGLSILIYLTSFLKLIPSFGGILYWVFFLVLSLVAFLRCLALFVSGLLMLKKTPEEVEQKY